MNETTTPKTTTTTPPPPTTTTPTTTPTTTTTTTTASTTASTLTTTTSQSTSTTGKDEGPDMKLVGGIVGGVGAVILIVMIVIFAVCWRRRRKRRGSDGQIRLAPGKEDLDRTHRMNQYVPNPTNGAGDTEDLSNPNLYVNVNAKGESNENTDPSVGPDGYLKKTAAFETTGLALYESEIGPQNVGRQNSMPAGHAPPPPSDIESSVAYVEGRAGGRHKTVAKNVDKGAAGYVNLKGHKKGGPVFGVSPKSQDKKDKKQRQNKKTRGDKFYVNETKELQNVGKDVLNLEHNYYNTKTSQGASADTLEPYANVTKETNKGFTQEEFYENP